MKSHIIVWGVVGMHLLLLGMLSLVGSRSLPTPQPHTPILVHTVQSLPLLPSKSVAVPSPKPVASSPKPVASIKPKSTQKPKPIEKSSRRQTLVAEAKKQLASIKPSINTTSTPTPIKQLTLTHPKRRYDLELIQYLQRALQLPEYGSVKIELALTQDGSIIALEILESYNPRNEAYVQSILPTLKLPLPDKPQHLTITLTNEI